MSTVVAAKPSADLSPLKQAYLALERARAKIKALEAGPRDPIAIIGIGCRFPGSCSTAEEFWALLRNGVDAVTEVPPSRWNNDEHYDPDPDAPRKIATRYGAFIDDVDRFDPEFFGISPREAATIDPQQRLLLEASWEAIERAGIAPASLYRSLTGVFLGICNQDYASLITEVRGEIQAYLGTGNSLSAAAGRLSYILGLQGPSMVIDTACSSSLVALHLACQSLRNRECDLALAGGAHLMLSPVTSAIFSKSRMLAPDGRCKTFDAAADGYVRGEGIGVVAAQASFRGRRRSGSHRRRHSRLCGQSRRSEQRTDGSQRTCTTGRHSPCVGQCAGLCRSDHISRSAWDGDIVGRSDRDGGPCRRVRVGPNAGGSAVRRVGEDQYRPSRRIGGHRGHHQSRLDVATWRIAGSSSFSASQSAH
jgi:hypothetical protein